MRATDNHRSGLAIAGHAVPVVASLLLDHQLFILHILYLLYLLYLLLLVDIMYLNANLEHLVLLVALALCPNFADLRVRAPPDSRPPVDGDSRHRPSHNHITAPGTVRPSFQ